jgi:hypothetical protein
MQWLGRGYQPSRRTWYLFRDRVGNIVTQLHQQLLERAIEKDLLSAETGAQDGTSVAACASRHQLVNRETLERRMQILDDVIGRTFPSDKRIPLWVPPTDSGRMDLAQRMRDAADVLSKRLADNAKKHGKKRKDSSKINVSLTDVLAPLGRDKMKVFRDLTRFHGRGIQRTRTETGLVVLTQNLLRLDRLQRDSVTPGKTTT